MATRHSGTSRLVLVAEDYGTIGFMLSEDLSEAGFDVSGPFPTCAAALASLRERPPDAAILDIELNDGPCIELAQALKCMSIPFLILTGHSSTSFKDAAFSGVPWLTKPFSHEEVIGSVGALLGHPLRAAESVTR